METLPHLSIALTQVLNDGNRAVQSEKTNEAPGLRQQARKLSDSSVTESNTQTTVVDSRTANGIVKVYPGWHRKPPDRFRRN